MGLLGQTPVAGRRAYWRMENNALDIQGDNTGILPPGAAFVPDRNGTGLAYRVNGAGSRIPVAVQGNSLDMRRFTVSAWVKPDGFNSNSQFVAIKTSPGSLNWGLFLAGSAPYPSSYPTPNLTPNAAVIMFYIGDINFGYHYWAASPQGCSGGNWCHITGSYDGLNLRIYFNGVLANVSSAADQFASSGQGVTLGSDPNGSYPFYGGIDEVQVFDRALTDTEVLALYNSNDPPGGGTGPTGPTGPTGITGYERYGLNCTKTLAGKGGYDVCNTTCPGTKLVLGGGVNQASADLSATIVSSMPSANNTWSVLIRNDESQQRTFTVAVWAVCANVAVP